MQPENQDAVLKSLLEQVSKLASEVSDLKKNIPTNEELRNEMKPIPTAKNAPFTIQPFLNKRKRGLAAVPLMEHEILEAQSKAKSAAQAAKYLNVSDTTYKKYATMYGHYEKCLNPCGKGLMKPKNPSTGKYPLNELLEGKYVDYPLWKLKDRMIRAGLKQACCENCGYEGRREKDGKIPLLIVFEDDNDKNRKLENMKVFCYNCSFTAGKIWVKIRDRSRWLNNPDRLQGAKGDTPQRY